MLCKWSAIAFLACFSYANNKANNFDMCTQEPKVTLDLRHYYGAGPHVRRSKRSRIKVKNFFGVGEW